MPIERYGQFYNSVYDSDVRSIAALEVKYEYEITRQLRAARDDILASLPKESTLRQRQLNKTLKKIDKWEKRISRVWDAATKKALDERSAKIGWEAAERERLMIAKGADAKLPKYLGKMPTYIYRSLNAIKFQGSRPAIVGLAQDLHSRLRIQVGNSILRGDDYRQLGRRIGRTFKFGRYKSRMIARTEVNRAFNRAKFEEYKHRKVKQVEVILAAGACEICQDLEGVHFLEELPGHPPFHPHCKCTVVRYQGEFSDTENGPIHPTDDWDGYGKSIFRRLSNYLGGSPSDNTKVNMHKNQKAFDKFHGGDTTNVFAFAGSRGINFKLWENLKYIKGYARKLFFGDEYSGTVWSTNPDYYEYYTLGEVWFHEALHQYGNGYLDFPKWLEEGTVSITAVEVSMKNLAFKSEWVRARMAQHSLARKGYGDYKRMTVKAAYIMGEGDPERMLEWMWRANTPKMRTGDRTKMWNELMEKFGMQGVHGGSNIAEDMDLMEGQLDSHIKWSMGKNSIDPKQVDWAAWSANELQPAMSKRIYEGKI